MKIRGKDLFAPLGVLITASGLQGEKPLVDRIMQVREVGKLDP